MEVVWLWTGAAVGLAGAAAFCNGLEVPPTMDGLAIASGLCAWGALTTRLVLSLLSYMRGR